MKPYIKNNCFWVPLTEIRKQLVKKYFQISLGKSVVENQYYEEEVEDILKIYKTRRHAGKRWVGFPIGRPSLIAKCLTDKGERLFERALRINDKRVKPSGRYKIKFTAKAYDYQKEAVAQLKRHGRGVLKSPPRSGKCVAGDSYVFTKQHGLSKIAELTETNHSSGIAYEVTTPITTKTDSGVHPVTMTFFKHDADVYEIRCASGRKLVCTPEHPMQVFNPLTFEYEWVRTDELLVGSYLPVDLHYNKSIMPDKEKSLNVPYGVPSNFPTTCTPELSELLALLTLTSEVHPETSDDDYKTITLSQWGIHDRFVLHNNKKGMELQRRIVYLMKKLFGSDVSFVGDTLSIKLRTYLFLNLLRAFELDSVPQCVLSSTEESQRVFLKTWMNVHSIFCSVSDGEQNHVEFGDNPKRLTLIQTWLTNFGINAVITPKVVDVTPMSIHTSGVSMKVNYASLYHARDALTIDVNWNSYYSPTLNSVLDQAYSDLHNTAQHDELVIPGSLQLFKDTERSSNWWDNILRTAAKACKYSERSADFTRGELRRRLKYVGNQDVKTKMSEAIDDKCSYDPIVSVNKLREKQTVYDIEVGGVHNFIANGLRAHNTVMSVNVVCDLKLKTLILAHQSDLLDQFLSTFKAMTNYQELEKKHGTTLVGICNSIEDYHKYQICLSTYQGFLDNNNGKEKLKEIRNLFGLVIVDECHRAPADGYSNVLLMLNAQYFIGLSGTPDRKDGKYVVADRIFGKIVHECEVDTLKPTTTMQFTGVESKSYKVWTRAMSFLASHDKRNKKIVAQAIKDIEAGHSVLIPVTLTAHADELVKLINKNWAKRHGRGNTIAISYTGRVPKAKREQLLNTLRDGEYRCCVAMRSMLTGINVPLWSAIYTVIPISNEPNYTQEVTRVLTPLEGKKSPIIRFFLDENWGMCVGCFATCWKTLKNFKIDTASKEAYNQAFALLKNRKGGMEDPYDDANKPRKSLNTTARPSTPLRF